MKFRPPPLPSVPAGFGQSRFLVVTSLAKALPVLQVELSAAVLDLALMVGVKPNPFAFGLASFALVTGALLYQFSPCGVRRRVVVSVGPLCWTSQPGARRRQLGPRRFELSHLGSVSRWSPSETPTTKRRLLPSFRLP